MSDTAIDGSTVVGVPVLFVFLTIAPPHGTHDAAHAQPPNTTPKQQEDATKDDATYGSMSFCRYAVRVLQFAAPVQCEIGTTIWHFIGEEK